MLISLLKWYISVLFEILTYTRNITDQLNTTIRIAEIGGNMRFLKKLPITTQLVLNGVLTLIVIVAILSLSYYNISGILVDKNKNYTSEITATMQYSLARYTQELRSILQNIGYDTNTQKIYSSTDIIDSYTARELNILAFNMINIKKDIFDVVIIGENGSYFTKNGNYDIVKNLMKSIPDDGKIYNTGFEELEILNKDSQMFFLYGMYFYSSYESDSFAKKLGFAAIMVDLKPIFNEINKISNNAETKYYLMDKNGMLYSPEDPLGINNNKEVRDLLIGQKSNSSQQIIEINGYENIVNISHIPEIEGKIISFVQEKELFSEIVQTRTKILKIFVIAIIIVCLLFLFTINNITRPIKKLIFFMNNIKSGSIKDLKKQVQLEGSSEINILEYEFNSMMNEINNLTRRLFDTSSKLYEAEIEKDRAELAYLRSQINPHFLYNTLEVMKGISLEEGVDKLYDMSKSLALIFRYSAQGSNIVELNDEISIIRAYIQIHIIRFSNRLEANFDFEESTLTAKVLKMTLQPLVENAIYHGLEPKRENGVLCVGSKYENGNLLIWVEDNGVGIEAGTLDNIKLKLLEAPHILSDRRQDGSKVDSIGIYNVNNRLKLTYGVQYSLNIESEKDIGTKVTITIPGSEV